jgi:methionyl-tRNA formyltransferase
LRLRVAFLGSPRFAVPTLRALVEAGHAVVCVYSQPPRPAGRGQHPAKSAVHLAAEALGLDVRTPVTLRDANEAAAFAGLCLDAAVVAAYGLILPKSILEAPRLGCFNVHASLLPRWRGAAPVERAILAGDSETGVTIMQINEGLDTGPAILRAVTPITGQATTEALRQELSVVGARLMVEALDGIARGALHPKPQPEDGATYAHKIRRDEGRLDWRQSAETLSRVVRALNPSPGVWFEYHGERIKVLTAMDCSPAVDTDGSSPDRPGMVLDDRLTVACGTGTLRLTTLQRPGRASLDTASFLRGYPITQGACLD